MKSFKQIVIIFVFFKFISLANAQVNFIKGYYIDNNNTKIECLIKNLDWKNNPKSFEYKMDESSTINTHDITNTKEFGIIDLFKYKRCKVNIDKISNDYTKLSNSSSPNYVEETLFLKYIVEGKISLLEYIDDTVAPSYFVEYNDTNVEQLFYKKYLIDESTAASNNYFRIQLRTLFKDSAVSEDEVQKSDYTLNHLTKLFLKYNNQTTATNSYKKRNKSLFNMYIKPGVSFTKFSLSNSELNSSTDFDMATSLRFGIELEYVFPINNNKWSISFEPTYNSFKTSKDFNYINTTSTVIKTAVTLDYKSIQLPLGFRHYMFLNQKSKLFLNAALAFDLNSSSKISSDNNGYPINLTVESSLFLSGGIGFNFNNLFSIEAKYDSREIINYVYWDSNFNNFSILLGYNILKRNNKK
ncbi:MAG: hypothetical protein JNJ52_03120 [Flavobacterium sp.]|nr:hypothetical protein [Flavobacterium sp.]